MYTIIKQKRKTFSIHVDEALNVIVKAPMGMRDKEIHRLISKHEVWIQKTLQKKEIESQKNNWRMTHKILYLGEYRTIHLQPPSDGIGHVVLNGGQMNIFPGKENDEKQITKLIETFYKNEAKTLLTALTKEYAERLHVSFNGITIRKQKTRWGSCSSKGNLSYNLKLMCAPDDMIAYVVLHEVMHLKHFNHSSAFWLDIQEMMPDYKQRMNYFKQFGQDFII